MKKTNNAVVVIPVYRLPLPAEEKLSLHQCMSVLGKHPIAIVKPEHLDIAPLLAEYPQLAVESFPDEYFTSLRGYNKLVLSEAFYRRFTAYRYMLIYQLDAYVFHDELDRWTDAGYDYIGAPWIPYRRRQLKWWYRMAKKFLHTLYTLTENSHRSDKKICVFQVGNGGFSLRKIDKMIRVIRFYRKKIERMINDDSAPFYPEDVFLTSELSSPFCRLRKPSYRKALAFAIEENPEWGYSHNHYELPFGCHDWDHPNYAPFWKRFIPNPSETHE